jgi:3-hydroxybutyryl-CoA dehydrogenase
VRVLAEMRTIGVLGAGQMGTGIAQVALTGGYRVLLNDISEGALARARAGIEKGLDTLVRKEKIVTADRDRYAGSLSLSTRLEEFARADFLIEAVTEKEELKLSLFRRLDGIVPEGAILASNTSSIPITKIAAATRRPASVIGMHFMNPVPLMKLVEVIRGLQTSEATYEATVSLARALGKEPVPAGDFPGFLVNRILLPMINEAVFALMEGVGRPEDIDAIMRLGANHPMGPLALADLIGLDTCLEILSVMHAGFGDTKYRPCPLLRQYVAAGWLGKKAGRGFYNYDAPKAPA